MSNLTTIQQDLANRLFEIEAVSFGEFRLKLHEKNPKAPLSPVYVNLRMLRRDTEVKKIAIDAYAELIKPLKFDLLGDVPTAATPLVSSLSDKLDIGMVTPRTDKKKYGSGAKVDGMLPDDKGKKVVLLDDLVTHADSKIEAAEVLWENGLEVDDVVVLIDREQGGEAQMAEKKLTLHSAFTLDQMMTFYVKVGKMDEAQYKEMTERLDALTKYME